ncbi:MAG: FixH family protein [Thermodesulfovibrionales bacterium]
MKITLMAVTALVLAAVAGTIIIGSRSFDGLVTEKPYEAGLAWDRTRQEKESSGWDIALADGRLRQGDNRLAVTVTDRSRQLLRDAAVGIKVSRPNTIKLDRTYTAGEEAPGLYSVPVTFPGHGLWDLKITVSKDQKSVSFDKRIYISKEDIQ